MVKSRLRRARTLPESLRRRRDSAGRSSARDDTDSRKSCSSRTSGACEINVETAASSVDLTVARNAGSGGSATEAASSSRIFDIAPLIAPDGEHRRRVQRPHPRKGGLRYDAVEALAAQDQDRRPTGAEPHAQHRAVAFDLGRSICDEIEGRAEVGLAGPFRQRLGVDGEDVRQRIDDRRGLGRLRSRRLAGLGNLRRAQQQDCGKPVAAHRRCRTRAARRPRSAGVHLDTFAVGDESDGLRNSSVISTLPASTSLAARRSSPRLASVSSAASS